jgi:hypothetical protein
MSTELHVFSDRRLASFNEWQQAIDAEAFPLRLEAKTEFLTAKGFVPARLYGEQAGFELLHDDAAEVIAVYASFDFDRQWAHALSLRWGANLNALRSGWMAATAYTAATNGLLFDPEQAIMFTAEHARKAVREIEENVPALRIRPANILPK